MKSINMEYIFQWEANVKSVKSHYFLFMSHYYIKYKLGKNMYLHVTTCKFALSWQENII